MARKPSAKSKRKLTNAERHKRFVAMAREVQATDDPKALDRVFKRVASQHVYRAKAKGRQPRS
jgi:hypothetical protein